MPTKKLNFSISPVNDNPVLVSGATFTNGFSHKNGFPTIKWTIPAQDLLLDTKSLYLCGQYIVLKADGNPQTVANANYTDWNLNNGTGMPSSQSTNTSNWNGISSVIDKLVIQSKKTQVELSNTVNYSMDDALKKGLSTNKYDYLQGALLRDKAAGTRHGALCRKIINSTVVADTQLGGIGDKENGQFFSLKLNVPLLRNQLLHLGNSFVGGLLLTIHLNPDASVFHSRHRSIDTGNQPAADPTGTSYILKSLKLEGKYLVPTQADLASYQSTVALNGRVNLMNDVISSSNSNTYTPQLSQVRGVVNTFLDDDQQNNFLRATNNFRLPVGLVKYEQAKNNIKYPHDFSTEIKPNHQSSSEHGANAFTPNALQTPSCGVGDAEARLQWLRSNFSGVIPQHTSLSKDLTDKNIGEDYLDTAPGVDGVGLNTEPDLLGIGADYTNNLNQSQNFVNQDYELKLECGVNTGRVVLPASRSNKVEIMETFVKQVSVMNLQTLQKQM